MSRLYPLIPFQTCLRQKGKSAWQKNVRTTFSRFSPSAVLPPSLLPVSSPPAPVKLGNLSKRERKRTQTEDKSKNSWIEAKPFRRFVPSPRSLTEAGSFERLFPFVASHSSGVRRDATWPSGTSLCFLHEWCHDRDAPGCLAFVVALKLTAAVKPAEVTQRTSPLLILFCGSFLLHKPGAVTCGWS